MPCSVIEGNIGRDPEMKYTPNGFAVANCSCGQYAGKDKDQKSKTTWYRLVFWRELAESVNLHIRTGQRVKVYGKIQPVRLFTTREGIKGASQDFEVERIQVITRDGVIKWEASAFDNLNQPKKVDS